jgi:hypothetical protein
MIRTCPVLVTHLYSLVVFASVSREPVRAQLLVALIPEVISPAGLQRSQVDISQNIVENLREIIY